MPRAPLLFVPLLAITAMIYYGAKLTSYHHRPPKAHFFNAIEATLSLVSRQLPRGVRSMSLWLPKDGHLVLVSSPDGLPADGRTRISPTDECSIWSAYSDAKSAAEHRNPHLVSEGDWIRREALPIADMEDRNSVAGVLSFEVCQELSSSEESRVLAAMAGMRSQLCVLISLMIVFSA